MIRAHFGIAHQPFARDGIRLLPHQQEIFDTLRVHCQQGGLCVLSGEPGTGKSVIKHHLVTHDPKRLIAPVVNRTLHTYHSVLRILCDAFQLDLAGSYVACERRLIAEAHAINQSGKMLVPIIDDAHLLAVHDLRRLRLLFEDFPKNHNLVLLAQPQLLTTLALLPNADLLSRITYSVRVPRLTAEAMTAFILGELDRCKLPHRAFADDAFALIVRAAEGVLRAARNLCLGALLEAVRAQARTVELAHVNRVLLQPHWREPRDSHAP